VIPYIRVVMRYFWIIGLFVIIAQESWAIVVSDTLIIDGEIIYIEERDTPLSDSLKNARKHDFKEKKKAIIWGSDCAIGMQITDFSISNHLNKDLFSVNDFLEVSNKVFYHSSASIGAYVRVHRFIEIGTSLNLSLGAVSEESAQLNALNNTVAFYSNGNQIEQVFETEVQPGVVELDTASVSKQSHQFKLSSFQIPLKFRFYVNEFSVKSKWRAFGEISPVYRSFKLSSTSLDSDQMLFLNSAGNFEYLNVGRRTYHQFGVLVGAGSEFQLNKRFNAFVQANWSFPPINKTDVAGVNYFTQYSTLFLGVRVLINDGK
jgi:hypothetical protein